MIMAHETFISYKYSDAVDVRDRIYENMGEYAKFYRGENGFSPNKSDDSDDAIWNYLKDMIWGTSVTMSFSRQRCFKVVGYPMRFHIA